MEIYQQGDVLMKKLDRGSIRKLKKDKIKHEEGGNVLFEGEVTGHAHRATDDVKFFTDQFGNRFMETARKTTIAHEEHKPITVPKGIYLLDQVREKDHFAEEVRRVMD
jgi:hypothetical protein